MKKKPKPKPVKRHRRLTGDEADCIVERYASTRDYLASLDAAVDWKRSKKGNLWCQVDDETLTVFENMVGEWTLCVAGVDGPVYFRLNAQDEDEAVERVEAMIREAVMDNEVVGE